MRCVPVNIRVRWHERRGVLPDRNNDPQLMICAFGFVVFAKPLSQAMNFDPRNGVLGRVEALRAFEHFNRDVILLDLVGLTGKILGTQILQ
jgi:hypothetical protein